MNYFLLTISILTYIKFCSSIETNLRLLQIVSKTFYNKKNNEK
jgi:hypothetical protein